MINIVGATHTGLREHNEDCFAADSDRGIAVVADGMGGYACGEVASELARQTVVDALSNNEGLREGIARAHAVVRAAASSDVDKKGMGSTVIALKMSGVDYEIAWVGDSRAYLWDGALKLITRDHSYVECLLATGAITADEAVNHPNRNLIMQAIGVAGEDGLEISVVSGRLGQGQQLLLCSDGLVDELTDHDIAQLMHETADDQATVDRLINAAVAAGGSDNITVVTVSIDHSQNLLPAIAPPVIRTTFIDGHQEQANENTEPSVSYGVTSIEHPQHNNNEYKVQYFITQLMTFLRTHNQTIWGSVVIMSIMIVLWLYLS